MPDVNDLHCPVCGLSNTDQEEMDVSMTTQATVFEETRNTHSMAMQSAEPAEWETELWNEPMDVQPLQRTPDIFADPLPGEMGSCAPGTPSIPDARRGKKRKNENTTSFQERIIKTVEKEVVIQNL